MEQAVTYINPIANNDELSVLFAGESTTFSGHTVGPKVLDYYLVHFVLEGKGVLTCRDKQYHIGAGKSFFIFPNEVISYDPDVDDPWRYRWIAFQGDAAARFMERIGITPEHPVRTIPNPRRMATLYWKLLRCLQLGEASCDFEASAYARMILGGCLVQEEQTDLRAKHTDTSIARKQVEQAMRYISLQYYQQISISNMAMELGYHRTYFCRIFKEVTGETPMQYLTNVRMEQATRLLKEPLTIQQVAAAVGYHDPLYFSKQFRKHVGVAPSQYLKQASD